MVIKFAVFTGNNYKNGNKKKSPLKFSSKKDLTDLCIFTSVNITAKRNI